ncbi:transmembrane protein 217 [Tiliqua scincoides]|uniref:transmembrane protein 217 n=1 Tax=Tiliqua scincoides TaxID=71010 RepID=UPI003461E0E9
MAGAEADSPHRLRGRRGREPEREASGRGRFTSFLQGPRCQSPAPPSWMRAGAARPLGSAKDTFTPLLADGFCGMLPKTGSVVGGLYMIVMTNMYLIFETGHMNRSLTIAKQFNPERVPKLPKLLPHCYYTAISLALLTYPVCVYYIYSVCKQKALGLLIYVVWIIFYDLANCVIIVVTAKAAQAAHFSISFLEWFGFARIPTDCFWLSFTVTYLLLITEGRVSIRLRRISKHVPEPPRFRLGINARRGQ